MAKYHISTDGNPRVCTASDGKCPLGGNEDHFTSKEAARAAFEESVEVLTSIPKKTRSEKSVRTVNARGDVEWRLKDGSLHRDGDLPAVEWADGTKFWFQNGQVSRDGGLPAVEWAGGVKSWYQNGKLHRDDGLPAIEYPNGSKAWWVNGIFQYQVTADLTRTYN